MDASVDRAPPPLYLRLSVTERCQFRCVYCRPPRGAPAARVTPAVTGDAAPASDAELLRLVALLDRQRTIGRLRLTGGEPLLRRGIVSLTAQLRELLPAAELCLTTNGVGLARLARPLRAAGLAAVNVSVDALDEAAFATVTRGGRLAETLAGLAAARRAGLRCKINAVLLRSGCGRDLPAMVRFAAGEGLEIRFIELMPSGPGAEHFPTEYLSAAEALEILRQEFADLGPEASSGTARRRRFLVEGRAVVVGLIAPVSHPFCDTCDRLRLDARGRLYRCLRSNRSVDLLALLRAGDLPRLAGALREAAVHGKPLATDWPERPMVAIGG